MLNMPMQLSRFLVTAQYLISIGLCPVLLDGKKPIFKTFDQYLPGPAGSDELALPLDRRPLRYSDALLAEWEREYPGANIGLLTRERPSIDVDAPHIWDAIKDLVPPTPHVKRGKKGFTLIYSVHPTDPVRRTRTFVDPFRRNQPDAMLLEVLANGRQTVLPPSIHPETGNPYEWLAMPEWGFMLPTPLSHHLPPPLSQAVVDAIEARLAELGLSKKPAQPGRELARKLRDDERRRYEAFLAPKLRERLERVTNAVKGVRRDELNGAVYALQPWVREGFIQEEWLEGELRKACELNGFIQEDGDKAFTYQFNRAMKDAEDADRALPDLDAGRAEQLLGAAPLASGSLLPAAGGSQVTEWGPADLHPRLVTELIAEPAAPREWTVAGWIPHKQVTLVYGDGGTGKTTLLMQLAMVASQGGRWFGHAVQKRKVLFVTAEDEMSEMQFRFQQMSRLLGTDLPDLTVVSLADLESCELMGIDGSVLRATGLLDGLCGLVRAHGADMVMLDPIADMFGGNEIDKRQVTKFMRTIRKRLAFDLGCTVVVAGHPSSDGLRRGTGESGSKAWSNSSRSRCYFSRGEDGETMTLELMKANRAKLGDKILMKWVDGVFVQLSSQAKPIISDEDQAKIMARLDRDGPIHQYGDRSPDWVGNMIGLELGKDLGNPKGKRWVAELLHHWEQMKLITKLTISNKQGNRRSYVQFSTVDASTVASTVASTASTETH